jgi:hypothetical protein
VSIIDSSVTEAKQNRPDKASNSENGQDQESGYNVKQGCDAKLNTNYGF